MNTIFCFKLGKTQIETYEMLQTVRGAETLHCSSVYLIGFNDLKTVVRIFRMIQDAGVLQPLEMQTRSQIPVKCRWSLRMVADELNINKKTIHQILHEDLRKMKMCAKFVSHRLTDEQKKRRLTDEQKQRRLTSCQDSVQICQDNLNFLIALFFFLR
jgi:hypothetical protein